MKIMVSDPIDKAAVARLRTAGHEVVETQGLQGPALIAALWDSLDESQVPLTPTQQAELERRLASLDHDRAEGVTWETLRGELERRCP